MHNLQWAAEMHPAGSPVISIFLMDLGTKGWVVTTHRTQVSLPFKHNPPAPHPGNSKVPHIFIYLKLITRKVFSFYKKIQKKKKRWFLKGSMPATR